MFIVQVYLNLAQISNNEGVNSLAFLEQRRNEIGFLKGNLFTQVNHPQRAINREEMILNQLQKAYHFSCCYSGLDY